LYLPLFALPHRVSLSCSPALELWSIFIRASCTQHIKVSRMEPLFSCSCFASHFASSFYLSVVLLHAPCIPISYIWTCLLVARWLLCSTPAHIHMHKHMSNHVVFLYSFLSIAFLLPPTLPRYIVHPVVTSMCLKCALPTLYPSLLPLSPSSPIWGTHHRITASQRALLRLDAFLKE